MNLLSKILLIIVIIVIIYLIYNYFQSGTVINLSGVRSATESKTIEASSLPLNNSSNNYAYSIWFYVNDWKHRLTDKKELLSRKSNNDSNPLITLAAYENNININITTYPTSAQDSSHDDTSTNHDCIIRNFPLQKWVNLIISLNGRTLDVYLDGKLVRTCLLPGVAKNNSNADVNITPNGGFSGWTSNFQYWSKALNPQEAYNVYKDGYTSHGLYSIFTKFKIKIAFLVDNIVKGSLTI